MYVISGPIWLPSSSIKVENKGTSSSHDDTDTDTDIDIDDSDQRQSRSITSTEKKKLYQYSYYGIGTRPSLVQVPTHFFKIIFTLRDGDNDGDNNGDNDDDEHNNENIDSANANAAIDEFAAFVIPNESFEKKEYMRDNLSLI